MTLTAKPHPRSLAPLALIWLAFLPAARSAPPIDLDICQIQGSGPTSPYLDEFVLTRGVVTFDLDTTWRKGFFIQATGCDNDPATSDALFVYIGEKVDLVEVGDFVDVVGWVNEFGGMTQVSALPENVRFLDTRNLPSAALFSPPWSDEASKAYFEAHEGMRIRMPDSTVVGPTTTLGTAYVVPTLSGVKRVFESQPSGAIVTIGAAGLFEIEPDVRMGDRLLSSIGILDRQEGAFLLQLTAPPTVLPGALPDPVPWPAGEGFSAASFNLQNLFDTFDDPLTNDPVLTAGEYQTRLEKLARVIVEALGLPLVIAVQEAENAAVLQALANRPEIPVQYGFAWFDGPDVRGIDVALLYRTDRVMLLGAEQFQGCTALVDGFGPDGNLDPINPANALTCDLDGLPGLDGNRLFSRPPLVAHMRICTPDCLNPGAFDDYWFVTHHLKSKSQDTAEQPFTLPRRLEQAAFLVGLVADIQAGDPEARVVLIGDFNDTLSSSPIQLLRSAGLVNLMDGVPAGLQFTYNFRGISQVLDHVFVSQNLVDDPLEMLGARPAHVSSDYPAGLQSDPATMLRASDHDPVLVGVRTFNHLLYIPILWRNP